MIPDSTAGCAQAPTVSIITMFLNEERFLPSAVASVFAQTFSDWELLLVNDGSTDTSPALARSYADGAPDRIRYIEHVGGRNRGMSASRNLGIRHARGEFIAFMDADDVWLPDKLAGQVALMREYPSAAMVYGCTHYWFSWTGRPEDMERDYVTGALPDADLLVPPPELLRRCLLDENQFPTGSAPLLRRSVVEQVGGYDETFPLYEDLAFYSKILLEEDVYVSATCWHRYRQHDASACAVAVAAGTAHPLRGRYLRWLQSHVQARHADDLALAAALRRALWPYRHPLLHGTRRRLLDLLRPLVRRLLPGLLRARRKRRAAAASPMQRRVIPPEPSSSSH
jgi:glycosyltransferase involved in cell wall biosynthesis